MDEIRIDGVVLAMSLAVTLLAGLLFGLAPALTATRQRLRGVMGESMRTLRSKQERLRRALAVAEIAFAILLLSRAGLLLRSFSHMRAVDPGFGTEHVLFLGLGLPDSHYPDAGTRQAFYTTLHARLAAVPGRAMSMPVLQTGRAAFLGEMTFALQSEQDPADLTSAVRAAVPAVAAPRGVGNLWSPRPRRDVPYQGDRAPDGARREASGRFEVSASDPATLATVAATLLGVSIIGVRACGLGSSTARSSQAATSARPMMDEAR